MKKGERCTAIRVIVGLEDWVSWQSTSRRKLMAIPRIAEV